MKKLAALTLLLLSSLSFAGTNAIYGEDSRIDVEDSTDPVHKELANSVAAMIPGYATLEDTTPGFSSFFDLILKDTSGVCSEEKFSHQQTVSTCTKTSLKLLQNDLIISSSAFKYQQRNFLQEHLRVF